MNNEFIKEERIEGFSREQLLVLSVQTIKALNWKISYISAKSIVANSIFYNNEEKTIRVSDDCVQFKSSNVNEKSFNIEQEQENSNFFFVKLHYLKDKLSTEQLNTMYEELTADKAFNKDTDLNQPKKLNNFFSIFVFRKGYYITPILFYLNLLIFIIMLFNGAGFTNTISNILTWGGNYRPYTIDKGQWWRLLTNIFIHYDISHVLGNMALFVYFGVLLEPYVGKLRFAVLYILTGLVASITSLYWQDWLICCGSSGAIHGLFGVFIALLTTNIIKIKKKTLFINIAILILFLLSLKIKNLPGDIRVDNAAHVGGFVSGIIFGYGYYFSLKSANNKILKIVTVTVSSILTIILIIIIIEKIPKTYSIYEKKTEELDKHENKAIELYNNQSDDKTTMITQLAEGINEWHKCDSIVSYIDKMDIPKNLKVKNPSMHTYLKLRIETYEMQIYNLLTDSFDEDLYEEKENKIDSLTEVLKN